MNKNLLFITCLLSLYYPYTSAYDVSFDGLKATFDHFSLQDFSLVDTAKTAYQYLITYHDYLLDTVENVNIELKENGGKRLPILCSADDYFYHMTHYLPVPIVSLIANKQRHDYGNHHYSLEQKYTPEERQRLFATTVNTLPPALRDHATKAKAELEAFLILVPSSGIHLLINQHYTTWIGYLDTLKSDLHSLRNAVTVSIDSQRQLLQDYIDQDKVEMELSETERLIGNNSDLGLVFDIYRQFSDDKLRMETIRMEQRNGIQQWQQDLESGFLDAVTTLGPLRGLAEEMFSNAMDKTLVEVNSLTAKMYDKLMQWNSLTSPMFQQAKISMATLSTVTTLEELDIIRNEVKQTIDEGEALLDVVKRQQYKSSSHISKTINSIWNKATLELVYSRWQWIYWRDIWRTGGFTSVLQSITSLLE
ncbi:uncharacterized protein BX664DRAFT_359112 [Halteromyces radiatus]|uniref:uncharacterized protein n=1 Tax=Halteromyces radiatus TaxID=101107 RepID=UPI00221FDF8A|nr:uncharacterized protein BX664DRAFT_359112 [Halteromyces radiatus]KAI8089573.1 hypothetical protein BX664DRAFT_359112 [Halteromyces radiatus]